MSSHISTPTGSNRRDRLAQTVAGIVGAMFVVFGVWALVAPQGFFDTVALFEPYNPHFIHDIGAFQIGLGAVLLLALFVADALLVSLAGVAVAATLHLVSHVIDRDMGGTPGTDIPFFAVISVVLIAAAATRAGTATKRR
ncbi:MAG TPA: hypothetical protein VMM13_03130 [Euzebya sp.]|nr:hypothetical protein [Euzebya sp.]